MLSLIARNALADPYILGINSGASTGAALAILFGVGSGFGEYALQGAAFIGALAASAVTIVFWSMGRRIDALTVGDDAALTLGVNSDRMRVILVVLTCILVGSVVAMAGSIGFVGLVIPHAARRLVGGSHRHMIPVAALLGASLLIAADIGAHTLLAPQEIPIGILTSLVGAPFLILLVRRMGVLK